MDCGESDPIVLEFDHRPGEIKLFSIGENGRLGYGIETLKAEMAKCDIRCANCHRRVTVARRLASSSTGRALDSDSSGSRFDSSLASQFIPE